MMLWRSYLHSLRIMAVLALFGFVDVVSFAQERPSARTYVPLYDEYEVANIITAENSAEKVENIYKRYLAKSEAELSRAGYRLELQKVEVLKRNIWYKKYRVHLRLTSVNESCRFPEDLRQLRYIPIYFAQEGVYFEFLDNFLEPHSSGSWWFPVCHS